MDAKKKIGQACKLVLFDLDQTLIDLFPLYDLAFSGMCRRVYAIDCSLLDIDPWGKSVLKIIAEICAKHGVSKVVARKRRSKALVVVQQLLHDELRGVGKVRTLKGVRKLLSFLRGKCVLGVITGTPRKAAREVLKKAGLAGFFSVAAFGDQGSSKEFLARKARREVEKKLGGKIPWREVVIVGDSLREVEAAKKLGARSVAVATGFHSKARLKRAGADFVFGDFSDYSKAAAAVLR